MSEQKRKVPSALAIVVIAVAVFLFAVIAVPNRVRSPWTGPMNACINNLRQIDGAIQEWALKNKRKPEDIVVWNDITPYLKRKAVCPEGGKYIIGPAVSNVPTCSIPGHALPP